MSFSTIPEMFLRICEQMGDSKPAFKYKKDGKYTDMTCTELREKVECLAVGLLELGVRAGDRIGIASENRIEWIVADFAITGIGAVDVPVFAILTAKQEEYIFGNCEASAIFVSNNFQLGKVMEFKDRLPSLRHIIVMNDDFKCDDVAVKSMNSIIRRGSELKNPSQRRSIFADLCSKVKPDDLLTLIYTSGTTGDPKGVMLTHRNITSNIQGCIDSIHFDQNDVLLSYLPLCHSYERTTGYYKMFAVGATMALAESVDTVAANLIEIKPTVMTTVPKLLEKVKTKIYNKVAKESKAKQKIFHWAVTVGTKYALNKLDGKNSIALSAKYKIADKLVFAKIRTKLGGRMKMMVSGGAALTDDVAKFFFAAGITVIQGYGLTETSPVLTCNRIDDIEIGTIGKPLPNVEIKIAADGEILARGPNIMKGYWADKHATAEAIDDDGWLYTGDIGKITLKGNIKITDRKKHIFVSNAGKNIAPQPIENLLTQSKYIEQVILIGDYREYCTALITPDFEQLESLAADLDINFGKASELIINEKIISHVKRDIDYIQKDLAKYERVRRFAMLAEPFSVANGELSPKMSIKRHVVEKKYAAFIDAMYGNK